MQEKNNIFYKNITIKSIIISHFIIGKLYEIIITKNLKILYFILYIYIKLNINEEYDINLEFNSLISNSE